jgi:hypothetical protein
MTGANPAELLIVELRLDASKSLDKLAKREKFVVGEKAKN